MKELLVDEKLSILGVPGKLKVFAWDKREEKGKPIETYRASFQFYCEEDGYILPCEDESLRYLEEGTPFSLPAFLEAPYFYDFFEKNRIPIKRELSRSEIAKGLSQYFLNYPERIFYPTWDEFDEVSSILNPWRELVKGAFFNAEQYRKIAEIAGSWWALGEELYGSSGSDQADEMKKKLDELVGGDERILKTRIITFVCEKLEKQSLITFDSDYGPIDDLRTVAKGLSVKIPYKTTMDLTPLSVKVRCGYGARAEYVFKQVIEFKQVIDLPEP